MKTHQRYKTGDAMAKTMDIVKELSESGVHFIYHNELHCPVKKGHNSGAHFYKEGLIFPEKKLVNFCSMCGMPFTKGITKTVNCFTTVIE